jgi:ATP-dependent DNA helicase RecG
MIPGLDEREVRSLGRLGIRDSADLVFWLPRWHLNKARIVPFAEAKEGVRGFFLARIARASVFSRGRLHIIRLKLEDGTGQADLYWFNRPYLASDYRAGCVVAILDAPERTKSGLRFSGDAGTCEVLSDGDVRKIEAGETMIFYRTTTVINQERARALAGAALTAGLPDLQETLPHDVTVRRGLVTLAQALTGTHRPATWADWEQARRRLVFEQLFLLQVALGLNRIALAKIRKRREYVLGGKKLAEMRAALPFVLTRAQERAISEVGEGLAGRAPMNRLLQGDVGSGKTVVAAAAVAIAADSGHQSAVMAPTEILAEQHFRTFTRILGVAGIRVGMLSSGQGRVERRQVLAGLAGGYFDLVVGTHALLEDDVEIPKLGLVVIDERHKFGVRQRAMLEKKGKHPDVLMMTATPLPRALVLTQYGDTALSVLDEIPPGRGSVTTSWVPGAAGRDLAYRAIAKRLAAGERAFAVFPLVGKSETLALRDATREYERLTHAFPDFRLGLIHGQMPSAEKEKVMADFASGAVVLLVATTVVEVGIDMKDATVMLVEHANRFGLAQLHQLRGRVGRGTGESWCFLLTSGPVTSDARLRLNAMVKTRDGFQLAEQDLRIRGPGELFGVRQHGVTDPEYLDLMMDAGELSAARTEAEALLAGDPELSSSAGARVRNAIDKRLSDDWGLVRAS